MTLEERKAKYRRDHGIPDDYEILTDAELAARRQAEQTTAVGAAYEGGLDVAASGAGGGLGYAGVKGLVSKLPLEKIPGIWGKLAKHGLHLGGMVTGAVTAEIGQEAVLDAVRTEDENEADRLLSQELRIEHPIAFPLGEVVGGSWAAGVGPTFQTTKGLGEIVRTVGGLRGKQNKEVVDFALTNIGIGGGLGTTFEGIRQYGEGEFRPKALITHGIGSALFSKPVLHGRKLYGTGGEQFSEAQAREIVSRGGVKYGKVDPMVVDPATGQKIMQPGKMPKIEEMQPQEVLFEGMATLPDKQPLTPAQRKARLDAYIEAHKSKEAGAAAIKKSAEEPSMDSSADTATILKRKDPKIDPKKDPKITEAIDKFSIKSSVEGQAKTKLKSDIDKMSDSELSSAQRQARLGAAGEYVKELGYTNEEVKAM